MVKTDSVCGPDNSDHAQLRHNAPTVTDCANECKAKGNCRFFAYGKWTSVWKGYCMWEKTLSGDCPKGFQQTMDYDFYAMPGIINFI